MHNCSIIALLKAVGCRLVGFPLPYLLYLALLPPPPLHCIFASECFFGCHQLAPLPPWALISSIVPFLFHILCLAMPVTPPISAPQCCISCHLTTTVAIPALDMLNATSSASNLHFLDFWATLKMEGASCSERLVTNIHQHVSISQKTKRQNVINKKWRTWA